MKKALITGASSGIGKEMAIYLDSLGMELILVSKDQEALENLQKLLKNPSKIIVADLSIESKVKEVYVLVKQENIDILINNAGIGLYGDFVDTDLNAEIDMINTNIVSVHILTKLFLKDFVKRDSGYILNVASAAAFLPGPKMAAYYATKSYIHKLTISISEELRQNKSNVSISSFCPGPVNTDFCKRVGIKPLKGTCPVKTAKYGIDNMLNKKTIIVPNLKVRLGAFFSRFLSNKSLSKISYKAQLKKKINKD